MKILSFSKRQYKSLMLQLFVQLLSIVLFMVAFLLIINSRFIETLFYARSRSEMSHAAQKIDELEKPSDEFLDKMKGIESNDTAYVEIFQGDSEKLLYSTIMNNVRKHTMFYFEEDKQLFLSFADAKKLSDLKLVEITEKGTFYLGTEVANDIEYLMYTTVLENGDTVKIYAQNNIIQSNAEYTSDIIRVVICVVGTALMIAFFIYAWLFTRPLIEMNDVTKHMAKMDFSKKCVAKSMN